MQLEKLIQGLHKDILSRVLLISTFLGEIIKTHSSHSLQPPQTLLLSCITSLMLLPHPLSLQYDFILMNLLDQSSENFSENQTDSVPKTIQWIDDSLDNGINPSSTQGKMEFVSFIASVLNFTF